jgi:hypothetical protein
MTEAECMELRTIAAGMSDAQRRDFWEMAAIAERHEHIMLHGTPRPLSDRAEALGAAILARFKGATWYHGGAPGRHRGDRVLPASVTGADPRSNGWMVPDRADYVHITADRDHAQDFAQNYPGGGVVYVVQPVDVVRVLPVQLRLCELMILDIGDGFELLSIGPSFCCYAAIVE